MNMALVLWGSMAVIMMFTAGLIGKSGGRGTWLGILLDERGRYSLSKFQLILWSIMTLSLLAGVLGARLLDTTGSIINPLAVSIPEELLTLMGISGATTAAAAVVKSGKDAEAEAAAAAAAAGTVAPPSGPTLRTHVGSGIGQKVAAAKAKIEAKADPAAALQPASRIIEEGRATITDLFTAEEGMTGTIDVTRFQAFWATLVMVTVYVIASVSFLATTEPKFLSALPGIDGALTGLLAISQGAYVATKIPNK